ncbi:MAG: hypothetical protein Q9181_000448 [Wetmoreana brouardii]
MIKESSHYSEANHLGVEEIKKAFSEWRVTFTKISDIVISEYEKKVVGPSNPRNEFDLDRFAVVRFKCVEPPTYSGRIMRPPVEDAKGGDSQDERAMDAEDPAEPPKPETFPLAQLVNPSTDGFTGLEIRLAFRRFKWKPKNIPNMWMWPAIVEFLDYNARLAGWAELQNMHLPTTGIARAKPFEDKSGNGQWIVYKRNLPNTDAVTVQATLKLSSREEKDENSVDSLRDRIRVLRDSEQNLRKATIKWEEKAKNAWKDAAVLADTRERLEDQLARREG